MLYRSLIATVLGVSMHDTTYTYNIYICVCLYVLMQFLDEHAQPSISGLLPVRLVPRQRARDLTRLCTRSSGSTLRIFMSIYSILPRLVQPTLFYSMHCFFFSAHFSASLYLTLLYFTCTGSLPLRLLSYGTLG